MALVVSFCLPLQQLWMCLLEALPLSFWDRTLLWLSRHLPFPCLRYDMTPSTHFSNLLSVGQCCLTCGHWQNTSEFTWGACKRKKDSWVIALTNPRKSGVGAKGLFPKNLNADTPYSVQSTAQTVSQVCSFNPIQPPDNSEAWQ